MRTLQLEFEKLINSLIYIIGRIRYTPYRIIGNIKMGEYFHMRKVILCLIMLVTGVVIFNSLGDNVAKAGNEKGLRELVEQQQGIIQQLEGKLAESNEKIDELYGKVEELNNLEERLANLEDSTGNAEDYNSRIGEIEEDLQFTKEALKIDQNSIQDDINNKIKKRIEQQLTISNLELKHCDGVDPNYCNGDSRLIGQLQNVTIDNDLYNFADYITEEELQSYILNLFENKKDEWNQYLKPAGVKVVINYRENIVLDLTVNF